MGEAVTRRRRAGAGGVGAAGAGGRGRGGRFEVVALARARGRGGRAATSASTSATRSARCAPRASRVRDCVSTYSATASSRQRARLARSAAAPAPRLPTSGPATKPRTATTRIPTIECRPAARDRIEPDAQARASAAGVWFCSAPEQVEQAELHRGRAMRRPVRAACARRRRSGRSPSGRARRPAARLASGTTIVFEPGPLAAAAISATPAVSSAAQIATPAPHGDVTAQPDGLAAALGDQARERDERVEDGRAVLAGRGAVDLAHRARGPPRAGRAASRPRGPCRPSRARRSPCPRARSRAARRAGGPCRSRRAGRSPRRARAGARTRAGECLADAAPPRVRQHAERADPSGRAEARAADAADRAPVALGDEDVAGGALARERDEAGRRSARNRPARAGRRSSAPRRREGHGRRSRPRTVTTAAAAWGVRSGDQAYGSR